MFRCRSWVTTSRVFSTKTVDYVVIYENYVFYYNKSLGSIVNFPNGRHFVVSGFKMPVIHDVNIIHVKSPGFAGSLPVLYYSSWSPGGSSKSPGFQ